MKKAIVVGAGLAGSYIAYTLGQKGYAVQVFEKRPDPTQIGLRKWPLDQPRGQ